MWMLLLWFECTPKSCPCHFGLVYTTYDCMTRYQSPTLLPFHFFTTPGLKSCTTLISISHVFTTIYSAFVPSRLVLRIFHPIKSTNKKLTVVYQKRAPPTLATNFPSVLGENHPSVELLSDSHEICRKMDIDFHIISPTSFATAAWVGLDSNLHNSCL